MKYFVNIKPANRKIAERLDGNPVVFIIAIKTVLLLIVKHII
jgi:hypothetical protein